MGIFVNQLRIDNYVFDGLGNLSQVTPKMILEQYQSEIANQEYLQPIPLTEQWLLDFGWKFDENDGENIYYGNGVWIYQSDNYFYSYGCSLYGRSHKIKLKHVHQLQNLFFALTGEELTIKEKVK